MSEDKQDIDWSLTTWEGSRRAQVHRALEMTVRERLEAAEGLADVGRRFQQIRAQGGFKPASPEPEAAQAETPPAAREPRARYGSGSDGRHDVTLHGCTPEPLMNYLKALGVLRLVAEDEAHGDKEARGYWQDNMFVLRSRLDPGGLRDFFLNHYSPTPIVAPWGARSGFYVGSSENAAREALKLIMQTEGQRLAPFRDAVRLVRDLLVEGGLTEKAKDEEKLKLLQICRRRFPDSMLNWIDSCYVLTSDGRKFPPLLGTGGNEGSGSYVSGFAQQVAACIVQRSHDPALEVALFGGARDNIFSSQVPGHFSPNAAGGPNASQGLIGPSTTNAWDYLLCLEGTCLWASGVVRRFGQHGRNMAAFPFTVNVTGAGASFSLSDSVKPKQAKREVAEIWLPLWRRPMALGEISGLLVEGRATVGARIAESGVDLARAAVGLGVDRGITEFQRNAFLMRNGQSFLCVSTGRFVVHDRPDVGVLHEVDPWLARFRRVCKVGQKGEAPARLTRALRRIDEAVFDYCNYGGSGFFQPILSALGQAERELMRDGSWATKNRVSPLAGLSPDWIAAANDGSVEFELALALAGVHDAESNFGPLRTNLEPVVLARKGDGSAFAKWAEKDRAVVWNAGDLASNMAVVLARRVMDGNRKGCERLPLASRHAVTLEAATAFVAGEVDDSRVEDLLWGLMLVDGKNSTGLPQREGHIEVPPLPRAYALLKLLFLPLPLVADRDRDGKLRWRYRRQAERGVVVSPEPMILPLLRAGRTDEACEIAARRLRVNGFVPMSDHAAGSRRVGQAWGVAGDSHSGDRLAAALLLPIASRSVDYLVRLVTRQGGDSDAERFDYEEETA